jgi:competence protein ComEA
MSGPSPRESKGLLRRAEQATVAALTLTAVGLMVAWWVAQGGCTGRLVEIEHTAPQTAKFQIDINKADWPELAALPGIGRTLAERIVDSRQKNGDFVDHNDLRRVRGIGPKTLETIRPYLLPMPGAETVAGN